MSASRTCKCAISQQRGINATNRIKAANSLPLDGKSVLDCSLGSSSVEEQAEDWESGWSARRTNQSLLALEEESADEKWEVCRFPPELPESKAAANTEIPAQAYPLLISRLEHHEILSCDALSLWLPGNSPQQWKMDAHSEQPAQVRGQRAAFKCTSRSVLLGRPAFRNRSESETFSDTQKLMECPPDTFTKDHTLEWRWSLKKASNQASKLRTIQ